MKRCPACFEIYDNGEVYCELDGQALLDPANFAIDVENTQSSQDALHLKRESWLTGLVGVMVGIVICAGVYAAYALWGREADTKDQETPAYASQIRDPLQQSRPQPARIPEPAPASTEDPSPDPEPEVAPELSREPEIQAVAARLNQGPVSTGQRVKNSEDGAEVQTVIQMKDGTTVEVDAAWEDKQGVWYRRGGLVSFVESNRVKAITARAEAKSSPRDNAVP
jgi:hypothetical protein